MWLAMDIEWENSRPLASESEVDDFEIQNKMHFSDEHRLFLTTITNGGHPIGMAPVQADDCPFGAGDLHGVFGINHPKDYYDLAGYLDIFKGLIPPLVPFGYDEGDGPLFIDMMNKPGRVVYCPWDEFAGNVNFPTYHVADSIGKFLEISAQLAQDVPDEYKQLYSKKDPPA